MERVVPGHQRRTSDPTSHHSPESTSYLELHRSDMRPRLNSRHSSGGNIPLSPTKKIGAPSATLPSRPKHTRQKSRFAGRFEVMDLAETSGIPSADDELLTDNAAETSPVVVCNRAQGGKDRVVGRFQVSDLDNSPPKEAAIISASVMQKASAAEEDTKTKETAEKHQMSVGRFQITEVQRGGSGTLQTSASSPTLATDAQADRYHHYRSESAPLPMSVCDGPASILFSTSLDDSHNSVSKRMSDDWLNMTFDTSKEREVSLSPLPNRERVPAVAEAETKKQEEENFLGKIDSLSLLAELSKRMVCMSKEMEELRAENQKLKLQVKELTGSASGGFRNSA